MANAISRATATGRATAVGRVASVGRATRADKIYGVSWLKGSSPTLTRIGDSVGMVAAAGVGITPVTNNFDTADIYKDITEVTDVLGNVFIRIPKFYIKKCDGIGYKTWEISKSAFAGSYLPWCFWDFTNSVELPYIDVGKYTASLSGDNKLQSIANAYPLIHKNIVDFRTYAQANGAAYQQLDIHVVDVLQTLFIVEFATLNSQSIMNGFTAGQYNAAHTATVNENAVNRIIVANATAALYAVGQAISVGTSLGGNQIFYGRTITSIDVYDVGNKAITFDGAVVNIAIGNIIYNTGWKNGFSSGIAAKSGSLTSNSDGKNPFIYRGIENIFGNVWQFVDGVNINEYQAWICRNAASYASNVFASPYLQLSFINANADGNPIELGFDANNPFAHFSKTNGGSDSTYYCDYYYRNTGQRIARFGGRWYYGSSAGVFCWDLSNASSDASVGIAGRLLKKPL